MNLFRRLSLGAATLALSAGIASAATFNITVHAASGDGSDPSVDNTANLYAPNYGAVLPSGGVWLNPVTTIVPPFGTVDGEYRSPWDNTTGPALEDVNSYFAAGPNSTTQENPAKLGFATPQLSLKFLWGSIDSYNEITFFGSDWQKTVFGIDARDAIGAPCRGGSTGNFSCTALLTISFDQGHEFGRVEFLSRDSQAIEFAFIPLPAPALLLLTGIGALGGLAAARRRRETQT